MTAIIPNYILKTIFKLIIGKNYNFIEVKSLSLISWDCFKFIGDHTNFNVTIDSNKQFKIPSCTDNENKFLLIKPKSVKYLNLTAISDINSQLINQYLNQLVNLKSIFVDHNNHKVFTQLNFNHFRVNSMYLDNGHRGHITNNNHLQSYIKKLDQLYITSNISTDFILSLFNQTQVYGFTTRIGLMYHQFNIFKFPFTELAKTNRLLWLKHVRFNIITPNILNCFLKSSPKIQSLSFGICFHNLIYVLYSGNGNGNDTTIKPCECHNYDMDECGIWESCLSILSNHKHLVSLTIFDKCFKDHLVENSNAYIDDDNRNTVVEAPLKSKSIQSQPWVNSFTQMLISNKSIKTLTLDFIQISQMVQVLDPLITGGLNLNKLSKINLNYYNGSLINFYDDYKESKLSKIKNQLSTTDKTNMQLKYLNIYSYNKCFGIDYANELIYNVEDGLIK